MTGVFAAAKGKPPGCLPSLGIQPTHCPQCGIAQECQCLTPQAVPILLTWGKCLFKSLFTTALVKGTIKLHVQNLGHDGFPWPKWVLVPSPHAARGWSP